MKRALTVLCIASMSLGVVGCKKKPIEPNPAKMRECREMSEAGKQDPERDCAKCCKNAGSFSSSFSVAGCICS